MNEFIVVALWLMVASVFLTGAARFANPSPGCFFFGVSLREIVAGALNKAG